ncbi:LamG domain-containing protein [Aeoliella mucimassa]|uniref:LamG-like jellyroll fold domain-containing protein n=1 Tax=Aeoliella mucimassa TaxID=2527972 RepID=A0A518AVG9_9BACT|nr:LamG domain-containing protein [Aeoliella mucimassa]QDU58702.1 hypothetical protein Pan181_49420 [Aeoliella mucimassa]
MKHTPLPILLILPILLLTSPIQAALVTHYPFDADGSATVGADATLGGSASIDNSDYAVGSGSLALSAATDDALGEDGAVSGDSFTWTSDIRTVAFWMKGTAGDHGDSFSTLISLGAGTGAGERFDVRLDGDALRLEVQSGGFTTSSIVADDQWHHIAVVVPIDEATVSDVQYYIDGLYVDNFNHTRAIATAEGPLRIGDSYQDNGRDFKGNIDDVRLYDSALSAQEIADLAAVPEPSTICLLVRRPGSHFL